MSGATLVAIIDEGWQRAFEAKFKIDSLLPEQENALQVFLGGQNVFVSLLIGEAPLRNK